MIDLTLNKEDKNKFITNVLMAVTGECFFIVYADGSFEKKDFNIESYNEVLLQMEREYFQYKEAYIKQLNHRRLINSIKIITVDLISIISFYFSLSIDVEDLLKIALSFLIAITGIFIHQQINERLQEISDETAILSLMEEFIKRKEEFALDVVDKETGENKKWYVVNLSNIYKIASPSTLNRYTKEEYKLKKLPRFLKKDSEIENV